jgi:malonyl-CoA O-methyltransferase
MKWPFAEHCCHIVSINLVLEHIRDLNYVFKEAYRILRNEGILAICELHPERQKKGIKARFEDPEEKKLIEIDSYYHSSADYSKAGKNAGFKKINFENWYDVQNKIEKPRLISVLLIKD